MGDIVVKSYSYRVYLDNVFLFLKGVKEQSLKYYGYEEDIFGYFDDVDKVKGINLNEGFKKRFKLFC